MNLRPAHSRTHLAGEGRVEAMFMGIGRVVYKRVLKRIQTTGPAGDVRSLRTFAWLLTGMVLEQDIRLPRIALAMEALATMDA